MTMPAAWDRDPSDEASSDEASSLDVHSMSWEERVQFAVTTKIRSANRILYLSAICLHGIGAPESTFTADRLMREMRKKNWLPLSLMGESGIKTVRGSLNDQTNASPKALERKGHYFGVAQVCSGLVRGMTGNRGDKGVYVCKVPQHLVTESLIEDLIANHQWFAPGDNPRIGSEPVQPDEMAVSAALEPPGWIVGQSVSDGGYILTSPEGIAGVWRPL